MSAVDEGGRDAPAYPTNSSIGVASGDSQLADYPRSGAYDSAWHTLMLNLRLRFHGIEVDDVLGIAEQTEV